MTEEKQLFLKRVGAVIAVFAMLLPIFVGVVNAEVNAEINAEEIDVKSKAPVPSKCDSVGTCIAYAARDADKTTNRAADNIKPAKTKNNSVFKDISMDTALKYIKDKKACIIFFGFENCPWCKEAKPILKKAAKNTKNTIYYVKVRDKDNKLLYTEKQRKQLIPYIKKYMSPNKEKHKKYWLYVPLLVTFKNGKLISGHEGTVKGHNATKRKMTAKEKKNLYKTYKSILENT